MSEKMYKTSLLFMKVAQYKESISCKEGDFSVITLRHFIFLYFAFNAVSLPSGRYLFCQLVVRLLGGPGFGVGLAQLGNVNGVQVPRGCLFRPFLGLTYRFLTETGSY